MKKTKKSEPTSRNLFFDVSNLDLLPCLVIVLVMFIPTLTRPWLFYDERTIYEGTYFPTPKSLGELFEIIENFGLNFNLVSSNTFYSSNYIIRTSPFGQLFGMILSFFFKNEAFFYHLFNLSLHLINTGLVFFILKTCFLQKSHSALSRFFVIVLTSIWAIHPVVLEPVLLSTNFGALFSYLFFFAFLLDFLVNRKKNTTSFTRSILIPILFLVPMLINEYIVTLPLVLFVISFYYNRQENSIKKSISLSLQETRLYFYGLILYILYFIFFTSFNPGKQLAHNHPVTFFERVFWLAPQIFMHMLKLMFYPAKLSIDQTLFVKLGYSLYDPYALFCIFFLFVFLTIPLILFIFKNKLKNLFLLSWSLSFALLPFLHILMPSYTLSAERYLYAPLVLLLFSLAKIISDRTRVVQMLPIFLSLALVACLIRSHLRTNDWKDNESFINSTYKASKDPLFKGVRLGMLGKIMSVNEPHKLGEIRSHFIKTLHHLKQAKKEAYIKKKKYQDKLPEVIKVYGLDFNSLLTKIAFLEASSICLDLKGDYKVGLKLLEPHIRKNSKSLDPTVAELYAHFLIQDKKYEKASDILLQAHKLYPNNNLVLSNLFDLYAIYLKDYKKAEEYLLDSLKLYLFDPNTLLKAASFYQEIKNPPLTARYAYLHGLRTGSKLTYQLALSNYLNTNYVRGAKLSLEKLLKLDASDPETLYFASKYYYQLKDYQKALSYLTHAYKQTQKPGTDAKLMFDIAHNLAKLYLFLGEKDTAINLALDSFRFAKDKESLKKLASFYNSLGLTKQVQICLHKLKNLKS